MTNDIKDLEKACRETAEAGSEMLKAHVRATSFTNSRGTTVNRREYDNQRRTNAIPPATSHWHHVAKHFDIGVMDLDNIAAHAGFEDFEDMDRHHPTKLMNNSPVAPELVDGIKKHALLAEDMKHSEIEHVLATNAGQRKLQKSHVRSYTRKDGTVVKEHEDSRQAKKQAVKEDIMRQIREKRKENEAKSHTGTPPQADANRHKWDDLPDEENPRYALQGLSSKTLGKVAKGKEDLTSRAKEQLAGRGVDEHGKWLGFEAAEKHHGVKHKDRGDDEIDGHFQTLHHKVLGAIAAGHTDPKRLAGEELANRGHDHDGKWIGFDKAAKLHKVKE